MSVFDLDSGFVILINTLHMFHHLADIFRVNCRHSTNQNLFHAVDSSDFINKIEKKKSANKNNWIECQ